MPEAPRPHVRPLWIGTGLLAAGLLLGAAIAFGLGDEPFAFDTAWQEFISAARGPLLLTVSYAMNFLGGGWFGVFVVPIGVAVALVWVRRPWAAAYFVSASIVCAVLVQVLKRVVGRARPEDMIVLSDTGSFPSGHVANATTVAIALFVLFPHVWVALAGSAWVALMAFSRTYLGAHWVSDTIGGALVGAAAALFTLAAFAVPLEREARAVRDRHGEVPGQGPSLG